MVPVPHPSRSAYPAALILTGSIIPVPFVALVLTAIIYLLPLTTLFHTLSLATSWLPEFAVDIFSGLVLSLALWLLLSILFRGVVTRERLNPGSSSEIDSHKLSLEAAVKNAEATLNAYDEQQSTDLDTVHALIHLNPPAYKESVEKVQKCLQALEEGYQQSRFRWLDGSGYLTAWNSIHSAEEALIDIAPVEEVIKEAFRIDAALEGSPLPTRDDDLNMLRIAVRQLRPSAAIYYMKPPAVTDPIGMDALLKDIKKKDIKEVVDARMAIRTVRSRLDKFREESWDGLLRVRNRLIETALITGALSYILLSATLLIG